MHKSIQHTEALNIKIKHLKLKLFKNDLNHILLKINTKKSTWVSSSSNGHGNEVLLNRKSWVQILGYPSPVVGYVMDM